MVHEFFEIHGPWFFGIQCPTIFCDFGLFNSLAQAGGGGGLLYDISLPKTYRPKLLARDGCGDHFGLFRAPVRGQAAELETRAGWPARYSIALFWGSQARPVQPGRIHGKPVRGNNLYKGDQCTFPSLSQHTRRSPHLRTQKGETLPTRSEEEQTVVMICRPNSKSSPFTDADWIYVPCSLFFAPLCTNFNFL